MFFFWRLPLSREKNMRQAASIEKVSLDLLHATDETKSVLKSLGIMLFKNSLREVLALIWTIRPQSNVTPILAARGTRAN